MIPIDEHLKRFPPSKLLFCGVNYASHAEENPAATMPTEPFFFAKLPSAIVAPGEPIIKPYPECQLDYEVELAMVVGRAAHRVSVDDALSYVMGYTLVNDVSARDVQFRDAQITLGKNFDTFCPIGPVVIEADDLPEPSEVRLRTEVNGEVRQEALFSQTLFNRAVLLSRVSEVMTLNPGDVVTTGTPAGIGYFRNPQAFLEPGDVVVVECNAIGRLENPIVAGW